MRKLKLSLLLGLVIVFLVGCVNIPIGDGNKMKVSKEGIVFTDSDGNEHTITFDTESGSLYIDGFGLEDGFGLGETYEIPEDFPPDIPIPEDAEIFKASDERGIITLAYETEQSTEKIDTLYNKFFKTEVMVDEPNISEEESEDGPVKTFQGIRKDGSLDVSFIPSQEIEDGTTVAIVFREGNSEPSKKFPSDTFEGGEPFKHLPGDLFKGRNLLDLLPGELLDNGSSKEFPSDTFDDGSSEEFPSDTFDGSSEEFPSDTFNKKAKEFIGKNLPENFPMPDNIEVYQANDMLGVVVIAFETDVSPKVLGEMFDEYYQSEDFNDKPVYTERENNIEVVKGKTKVGVLETRYSPSKNIKDGSKVVVIFEKMNDLNRGS